jgi:hypothetical protein
MTDEQKTLVERLRSVDISWSETGEWCAEAADLIEAQAEQLVAWVQLYDAMMDVRFKIRAERDAARAENARLRERLTQATERLRDMLQGDDGQAWDEAERFLDIIAQETQP